MAFLLWLLLQVNVRVTSMDAELEFSFSSSTTGKQLIDQVWRLQPQLKSQWDIEIEPSA